MCRMGWVYILIVSCKLNYIGDTNLSSNDQNYCGVSYFRVVTKTVNKRSLGQNDTAWLGQNDTV